MHGRFSGLRLQCPLPATDDQESWKVGWKGKIEATINILKTQNPGKEIVALAIAGGPACDWERAELRITFCKNHPELRLKQLGDVDDLRRWLGEIAGKPAAAAPLRCAQCATGSGCVVS